MFELQQVKVVRAGRTLLNVPSLRLDTRKFTAILGHNGSGKSTLLKLLARQMAPDEGSITLDQQPLSRFSTKALARRLGLLPQHLADTQGLSVQELVRLGRYPWHGMLGRFSPEDQRQVERAIEETGLTQYRDAMTDRLSGGERQRAWIAMLLAQQSPLLLLDEPTSALDLGHQYDVLGLMRRLNQQQGLGVMAILHDINLSVRYADHIVALRGGEVVYDGEAEAILDPTLLSRLYDIEIALVAGTPNQPTLAVVS
ncbi:ABC transporter ATP-binding protein [Pokkaliibacter sp. CJK22405]|uniref:ABC transporter ATP-binding protein n=1 Tax=Pokkaliibacter sp. CJK22405 TaxID=3384615 RepID=UPI0039846915